MPHYAPPVDPPPAAPPAQPGAQPFAPPPAPPAPRSSRKPIVIGVIVGVAVFIVLCAIACSAVGAGLFSIFSSVSGWYGTPDVWWCNNGEIAVAQMTDGSGAPTVVAWAEGWDEPRVLEGWAVVAVEEASPVVWLVSADDFSATDAFSTDDMYADDYYWEPDAAGDLVAQPADTIFVWDAETGGEPEESTSLTWQRWQGPGQASVTLGVDPAVAADPSSATFTVNGQSIEAQLPDDVVAFYPIGWCPDGDHFAVVTLSTYAAGSVVFESAEETGATSALTGNRVLIFDAATGALTAESSVGQAASLYPDRAELAAWSGTEDVLYVAEVAYSNASYMGDVMLVALSSEGSSTEIGEWSNVAEVRVEADPDGEPVIVVSDGSTVDLWAVDGSAAHRQDTLQGWGETYVMASAWSATSGWLAIREDYMEGTGELFVRQSGRDRELYRVEGFFY